jgi:hypothetical protein
MDTLIFVAPTPQTPGFAKRQKRLAELTKLRSMDADNPDEAGNMLGQIVEFLADYVQAETREQALELIWNASQEQFDMMLEAVGASNSPKATLPSSQNSENSEKV